MSDERSPNEIPDATEPTKIEHALAKLSPLCRRVLARAYHEANASGSSHLTCEHLLLALAVDEQTAASQLMAAAAISADDIRGRLGFVQGSEPVQDATDDELPVSPRVERVLLAAEKECVKKGQARIGSLHLLAALLGERDGVAIFVLEEPGIGRERLGAALQTAYREKWED